MNKTQAQPQSHAVLQTLPGDEVRQILWGYSDRYDLQMLVQAARTVARGPVAQLGAAGARKTHEWTPAKNSLLKVYDESGITGAFLDPEHGGMFGGPKNLAMALTAFELAWVDGGAATASLAGNLGLAPIHECGTPEQVAHYMSLAAPAQAGDTRKTMRAAFALTEPLPYVGVETGVLCGKVKVEEWEAGKEPLLKVEKRGRFITNMDYAQVITAAVDTADARIKGSCMIILEEGDPGLFDRGAVTNKLVHQLSSTRDPIFELSVPASRIVGGYTIKDGVIIPNFSHGDVIEAVFKRTRITVGLMTSAKLLSAVEPVIRYQRGRFRGGEHATPGTPRFDLGIQAKQDAVQRLADLWAMGEAGSSLGFSTARLFDQLDPIEREKNALLAARGVKGSRATMKAMAPVEKDALEYLRWARTAAEDRDGARMKALGEDPLVRFALLDAVGNVLCPATKLWNTGYGANALRDAVSLMGGYGITEDCPGFLGNKWMDAQLEATYEGPESVQRRQMSVTMVEPLFLAQFRHWATELRLSASGRPDSGACLLASAMELWQWTLEHLQRSTDANGEKLYQANRQGVTFAMADALSWLLASRAQIQDVLTLAAQGPADPALAEALPGTVQFLTDLCQMQAARAAGEVSRACAELVFGFNRHPQWDASGCANCFCADDLGGLESLVPGMESGILGYADTVGKDGSHADKRGPCASTAGLEPFLRLQAKVSSCLTGCRLAKDRAGEALTKVMIPEALDYPRA